MHSLFVKVSLLISGVIASFSTPAYIAPTVLPHKPDVGIVSPKPAQITATSTIPNIKATSTQRSPAQNTVKIKAKSVPLPKEKPQTIEPKVLIPTETLNDTVRKSMINIFCTTIYGGDMDPISGSGIIISKDGVILTNAHVAQYFLLKDYKVNNFVTCTGRTGSPASPAYKLELLFMPKKWLSDNARLIKSSNPTGTGENDFALLLITGSVTTNPMPQSFPNVDIDPDQKNITGDVPVLLVGYPSQFLGGIETQKDLWLTSSPAYLTKLFYFTEKENVDAFAVGPNVVAQKGASGGAAVNLWSGKLEGLISTITEGKTTSERELTAISAAHINRGFKKETGEDLTDFLNKNKTDLLAKFKKDNFPSMSQTLMDALSTTTPAY